MAKLPTNWNIPWNEVQVASNQPADRVTYFKGLVLALKDRFLEVARAVNGNRDDLDSLKTVVDLEHTATGEHTEDALLSIGDFRRKNWIVNGGMQVDQTGGDTLSSSYLYRSCDVWLVRWAGTGGIKQGDDDSFQSGKALKLYNMANASTGNILYIRSYIDSDEARQIMYNNISLQCKIYHNYGSDVDYYITISYLNAVNDKSSVTPITTTTRTIPTNTYAIEMIEDVYLDGNVSNGIEIQVRCSGYIHTNTVMKFGDVQLEIGKRCTEFEVVPIALEQLRVQRMFYKCNARFYGTAHSGFAGAAGQFIPFPTIMRTVPSVTVPAGYTYSSQMANVSPDVKNVQREGFTLYDNTSNAVSGLAYGQAICYADARL